MAYWTVFYITWPQQVPGNGIGRSNMSQETMLFKVVVNILILAPSQIQSLCLGAQMNPTIFHLFNHCSTHNTFNNCHVAWLPQCIYERNYKGKSIIIASWHPQVKSYHASNAISKYWVCKIFYGFGNQGRQHFIDWLVSRWEKNLLTLPQHQLLQPCIFNCWKIVMTFCYVKF